MNILNACFLLGIAKDYDSTPKFCNLPAAKANAVTEPFGTIVRNLQVLIKFSSHLNR